MVFFLIVAPTVGGSGGHLSVPPHSRLLSSRFIHVGVVKPKSSSSSAQQARTGHQVHLDFDSPLSTDWSRLDSLHWCLIYSTVCLTLSEKEKEKFVGYTTLDQPQLLSTARVSKNKFADKSKTTNLNWTFPLKKKNLPYFHGVLLHIIRACV